ncbi:MAG: site-specific integrase [Pseudomonadota bacterium]
MSGRFRPESTIRGLELALRYDPASRILRKKIEQAKQRLSDVEEQLPPARYRTIPVVRKHTGKLATYCMERGLRTNDRLFPISRIRAYQIIQDAGKRAGMEKGRRHPHVFRHGFAVNAVLSSVPPMVLRNWMGHADIQTTLVYTQALAQDSRSYLDGMNF